MSTGPQRSVSLDRNPRRRLTDSSVQLSHWWALLLTANEHPPRSSCIQVNDRRAPPLIHGAQDVLRSHSRSGNIHSCWIPPTEALDNESEQQQRREEQLKNGETLFCRLKRPSWPRPHIHRYALSSLITGRVNHSGLTDLHWSIAAPMAFGWECKSAVFSWATMCCGGIHQRPAAGLRAVRTSQSDRRLEEIIKATFTGLCISKKEKNIHLIINSFEMS